MTRSQTNKPDFLNRVNGSQHPFAGGGLHLGRVVSVNSSKTSAAVRIPSLGITVSSSSTTGATPALYLKAGDSVVCGFLNNDNQELVVLGRLNIALDVYPTLLQFQALQVTVNNLVTTVNNLANRVSALENA